MDAPQRLSLLVVADAVEVEADRPPQQEPPAVLGAGAAVEEEPLELDQARVDDERLLGSSSVSLASASPNGSAIERRTGSKRWRPRGTS